MATTLWPTVARGDRNFAAHPAILRVMLAILRNMVTATRSMRMTPIKDVDKIYGYKGLHDHGHVPQINTAVEILCCSGTLAHVLK